MHLGEHRDFLVKYLATWDCEWLFVWIQPGWSFNHDAFRWFVDMTAHLRSVWHFGWYVLRQADISGQTLVTSEHLLAGAVTLQMSKIRSFEVAPLFVYERESLLVSFKHPSMHLIHFFTLSGSHIRHVKLIVDRLLRRVNRTVINLSLDSPFIVRHWHATKWSAVERFSRAKSA